MRRRPTRRPTQPAQHRRGPGRDQLRDNSGVCLLGANATATVTATRCAPMPGSPSSPGRRRRRAPATGPTCPWAAMSPSPAWRTVRCGCKRELRIRVTPTPTWPLALMTWRSTRPLRPSRSADRPRTSTTATTLAWSAYDGAGSGVRSTAGTLDGQTAEQGTVDVYQLAPAEHTVAVIATDQLSNSRGDEDLPGPRHRPEPPREPERRGAERASCGRAYTPVSDPSSRPLSPVTPRSSTPPSTHSYGPSCPSSRLSRVGASALPRRSASGPSFRTSSHPTDNSGQHPACSYSHWPPIQGTDLPEQ